MKSKNPLLGEVSRLHRDGEGLTSTNTRKPHLNRLPAFSLTPQAQRKSLAKRNAAKLFRRCDGEEATPPPPAPSPFEKGPGLPKLKRQKCRLNTSIFEKARPKLSPKHKKRRFYRRFLCFCGSFGRAFSKMAVFSRHFCLLRLGSPGPFSKGLGGVSFCQAFSLRL